MLDQQRSELEKIGFRIVYSKDDEICAVRQKFHADCMLTKLTYVVFVRQVDVLRVGDIDADRERFAAQSKQLDPSVLPRGFQKGVAVLALYVAGSVEPDARARCDHSPKIRFAFFNVPAALDQSTGEVHVVKGTPAWGAIYYSKFRYVARRVLAPQSVSAGEPLSAGGIVLGVLVLALLATSAALMFMR